MKTSQILGVILFLLAFNCSISLANALNLDYYGFESRIGKDNAILNKITLVFNSSIPDLDYRFRYKIYDLKTESRYAPVNCNVKVTDISLISCNFLEPERYGKTQVIFEFKTSENLETVDENYEISYFLPMGHESETVFSTIYLPETAILTTDVSNQSFSPGYGKTMSDGKHIIVYWEKENVKSGDDLYFSVMYRMPETQTSVYDIAIMVVIAVLIIVSLGVVYIKTTKRPESMKVVMPVLRGDEKTVVEIIDRHEGSVNQKVIVRESDFSKAKVSRLVANLKERGIVDVEVLGRMNKITLKLKR